MNKRALAWGRLAAHDLEAVRSLADARGRPSGKSTRNETLEEIVAQRVRFLTDYQNEEYAARYADRVKKIASLERSIGVRDHRLAHAVALYYFKLLSVKDEYEVMRLWASDRFQRQLDAEFEGNYRLEFHLAPQLFFPRNKETGRVRKLTIDRRVMAMLKWIRHLKFLRHSPLDVFNKTAHRRREWALVREYEDVLDEMTRELTPDNLDLAVQIAEVPEYIRGFDTVKDSHIASAKEKEAELLDAFRGRVGA